MKKMKLTFEFIAEKGDWPICIAKTNKGTFICLEYLPYPESYGKHCRDFLQAFLFGYSFPLQWQKVGPQTCVKRAFHVKDKEKAMGLLAMENLPL